MTSPDGVLDTWLHEHGEGLVAMRRNMHAHPELSGEERGTTEMVRERLELAGLQPRLLKIGTGLVCDLAPGTAGVDVAATSPPMLAFRADIDALAMDDVKDVPYRSQVPGVAHACGHDVHTAVVLGTALYFAHHRDRLPGPVRFVFQPAEERVPGGALDVIDDDGIDGVSAIVGLHCEPKLDAGLVGLKPGSISSAADMVCVTLTGPGGHTARPELTVDLITLAARVVLELPCLVRAALPADAEIKLVFGAVRGGDAANVIPTRCELRASVRTPTLEVWDALPALVESCVADLLAETGAGYEIDYTHGVPPVVNDAHVTDVVARAASNEFGADKVVQVQQSWGGDDFAWFTREIPGSYVRLGVHDATAGGPQLDLHAGHFDVDEASIAVGVRLLVATTATFFSDAPSDSGEATA